MDAVSKATYVRAIGTQVRPLPPRPIPHRSESERFLRNVTPTDWRARGQVQPEGSARRSEQQVRSSLGTHSSFLQSGARNKYPSPFLRPAPPLPTPPGHVAYALRPPTSARSYSESGRGGGSNARKWCRRNVPTLSRLKQTSGRGGKLACDTHRILPRCLHLPCPAAQARDPEVSSSARRLTRVSSARPPAGIVSTLHALIACAGAARCLHMSPALYEDMLWTTSNSARSRPASPPDVCAVLYDAGFAAGASTREC